MENLSLIVAFANNDVIGRDNKLIWSLPSDLKFFKEKTTGHHIIMGRKCFESIGRPLPNRTSVIITRDKAYKAEGCIVVNSLEEALEVAKHDNEPFIIGGGEIYKLALPLVNKIYITRLFEDFDGDTFFPQIETQLFTSKITISSVNNEEKYNYAFYELIRNPIYL